MSNSWFEALVELGATVPQLTATTGAPLADSLQCIDRSDLSVVSFSGADMATFLQSQTCNDHTALSPTTAQINGYCSPKGRLLGLPIVAMIGEDSSTCYWLLPKDIVPAVVKRLTMYVLRAEVNIVVQDWVVAGIALPTAAQTAALTPWLGAADAPEMSSWSTHDHGVVKTRAASAATRALLFGPADTIAQSLKACLTAYTGASSAAVQWGGPTTWHLGDIQAGIPAVVASTQDQFIPQMVNLGHIDGLSFTKGCYPGQEVVARLQYLGKLKRHMIRLSCPEVDAVVAGQDVSCGDDAKAGTVVSVATHADATECLAVVKTSADESGFAINGKACKLQPLPYSTVVAAS